MPFSATMKGFCGAPLIVLVLSLLSASAQPPPFPPGPWRMGHHRPLLVTSSQDSTDIHSLRGAIIEANRRGGCNTILIVPAKCQLSIQGADEDDARTGDLDIVRGSVLITALPGKRSAISAVGLGDRVLHVMKGARLTLVNLVITGGASHFRELNLGENGGGIYNSGLLTLQNCLVISNATAEGAIFGPGFGRVPGGSGAGIYNKGTLIMDNCTVALNTCGFGFTGGNGGGICNDGFSTLSNCSIQHNTAGMGGNGGDESGDGGFGGNGGGIYNSRTMLLNGSSISGNESGEAGDGTTPTPQFTTGFYPGGRGGAGGNGAGIYNSGKLRLSFCTTSSNVCASGKLGGTAWFGGNGGPGGSGGGIYNAGTLTLNTCTLSGNSTGTGGNGGSGWEPTYAEGTAGAGGAGGNGGGVYNSGAFSILSSTIAQNSAAAGGNSGTDALTLPAGQGGSGGGIFNMVESSQPRLHNTLVAMNSSGFGGLAGSNAGVAGTNGFGPDLGGGFVTEGYNLIGITSGSTWFTNGFKHDLMGSDLAPLDPLLGPLQNNGGNTTTHALLSNSPAIDQGNSFGVSVDQRQHHRPHDYNSITNAPGGGGCDIGAFEVDSRLP